MLLNPGNQQSLLKMQFISTAVLRQVSKYKHLNREADVQNYFRGLCIPKEDTKHTAAWKEPLGVPRVK